METILQRVEEGKSFAVCGPPGTGKSFILRQVREELTNLNQRVEAVAPTHAAARLIEGSTVHYFLGSYQNRAFEGWILFDEISMLTLPLIAALTQMSVSENN